VWRSKSLTPFLPQIKTGYKYTLCLDLDETLIYFDRASAKLLVRPYVAEFLERMSEIFELVVFTSI
jgi:TFIIF-interacting CTD phosphatase-like protein